VNFLNQDVRVIYKNGYNYYNALHILESKVDLQYKNQNTTFHNLAKKNQTFVFTAYAKNDLFMGYCMYSDYGNSSLDLWIGLLLITRRYRSYFFTCTVYRHHMIYHFDLPYLGFSYPYKFRCLNFALIRVNFCDNWRTKIFPSNVPLRHNGLSCRVSQWTVIVNSCFPYCKQFPFLDISV